VIKMKVREKDHGFLRKVKADVSGKIKGSVKIGIIGKQAEEFVEDDEGNKSEFTMARMAGVHEYGMVINTENATIHIPQRSFIRSTVAQNADYKHLVSGLFIKVLQGAFTGDQSLKMALSILGAKVKGDIQQAIAKGIKPKNAASTIKAKGSSTPLIDTGRLRGSITYEVELEEG
jgi:hypothetical protein